MIVISPGTNFLNRGAIVPEEQELQTIIHALNNEYDRVVRGGGTQYGKLSIEEMNQLIGQLTQFADHNEGS